MEGIVCEGFIFYNNFDSANLARVEIVPKNESAVTKCDKPKSGGANVEIPDAEFNIWTRPDCWGTEFENGNRTWFYFGLKVPLASLLLRFNLIDLNRQGKMYSQGMAPVYRISPSKMIWERIRDKPTYSTNDDIFTLTFKFRTLENTQLLYYFAFTYPFSCVDLEKMLVNIDAKYLTMRRETDDDIYYVRESICRSLEGRSIDLITISSYHGISNEREERLANLFRTRSALRPYKFPNKKVVFVSARVHPGETPSSFVFNGFLHLLLNKEDPVAQQLRRMYVFKLIPFLNPDGVAHGHYRTDTRGVNLNRVYRNPCLNEHPSIYAARALIRYYHFGCEKEDFADRCDNCSSSKIIDHLLTAVENQVNQENISKKVSTMKIDEESAEGSSKTKKMKSKEICVQCKNNQGTATPSSGNTIIPSALDDKNILNYLGREFCRNCGSRIDYEEIEPEEKVQDFHNSTVEESRLFLYMDLHGHASKKGIFMYGNHFDDLDQQAECMLLPKIMSINNHNFHFNSCNFTERNMYLKDKRDGMSRAGSGRVAVLSLTGIIRSYTLECNYNTGRIVNVLPPAIRELSSKPHTLSMPPKYTPHIFEEIGKALGASILDLTGHNPCTRIPNSEFHSLAGLREWLKTTAINEFAEMKMPKLKVKKSGSLQSTGQDKCGLKLRSQTTATAADMQTSLPATKSELGLVSCLYQTANDENLYCHSKSHNQQRIPLPKTSKKGLTTTAHQKAKKLGGGPSMTQSNANVLKGRESPGLKNVNMKNSSSKNRIKVDLKFKAKNRKELVKKQEKGVKMQEKSKMNIRKTTKAIRLNKKSISGMKMEEQSDGHSLSESNSGSVVKLHEICYFKNNEGKTMIAKYKNKNENIDEDKLVVSWDNCGGNPQIYTHKSRVFSAPAMSASEPGPSRQGLFRVHNFSRNSGSFNKLKKKSPSLRRLSSATDSIGKVDKKKKVKKFKK